MDVKYRCTETTLTVTLSHENMNPFLETSRKKSPDDTINHHKNLNINGTWALLSTLTNFYLAYHT